MAKPNRPGLDVIQPLTRPAQMRPNGEPCWPNLMPTRHVTQLPAVKNPVRARAHRASLDPTCRTVDAFGSTQLTRDHDVPRN